MYFCPKWIFRLSLDEIAPDMQSFLITLRLKRITQDVRHLLPTNVLSNENIDYSQSYVLSKKSRLYLKNKNTIHTADLSDLEL